MFPDQIVTKPPACNFPSLVHEEQSSRLSLSELEVNLVTPLKQTWHIAKFQKVVLFTHIDIVALHIVTDDGEFRCNNVANSLTRLALEVTKPS